MRQKQLFGIFICVILLLFSIIFIGCGSTKNTIDQETGEENIETGIKLDAPQNVWISDGILYWEEVPNADSYTISINNEETIITTKKNEYKISDDEMSCIFRIKANGNRDTFVSSEYGKSIGYSAKKGYYSEFDDLTTKEAFLGYGFDVIKSSIFSDKYVKTSAPILDSDEILKLRLLKVDSKYSVVEEVQSENMEDFMSQWNAAANVNVSYEKVVLGGSVNVELAYSGGLSNAQSKYFHCVTINNQKFYIVLQSDLDTYKTILSKGFRKDLYSDLSPAELFNRYGTHFITSAVMGGKIYSYYLYTSTEETDFQSIKGNVSTEIRNIHAETGVNVSGSYLQEAKEKNIDIKNTLEVLGGSDYAMLSDRDIAQNYAEWEKSLNEHASLIGIKDTGSLCPIWDLIDPALDTNTYYYEDVNGEITSGTRADQLQTYFIKYGLEKYNDLMQSSGLPSIEMPNDITDITVNGKTANEKNEFIAYAGIDNDIFFRVLPETAVGYTKSISVVGDNVYAKVNNKNQLTILSTAPSDLRVEVALSAGGFKKTIHLIVRKTYTVEFISLYG
ncbi:MAG: hypothetical protein K5765_00315, partial [Clostridia bacterium]|nr:hypothetical protein [Clostridia bacterium]